MTSYILTEGKKMASQSYPGDAEIITGLKKGDERAGTDLVLKYHKQLLAFLEVGMGVPWDQAGQVLNDVFLKLIRQPGLIRPGTDQLGPLLYRMCENKAKDWHRKRNREYEAFAEILKELVSQGEICDPDLESPTRFPQEHVLLMEQSLSGLDPRHRDVILERLSGCSFKEIAQRFGEKAGTVRQQYKRALDDLEERYLNLLDNQPPEIQARIRRKLKLRGGDVA